MLAFYYERFAEWHDLTTQYLDQQVALNTKHVNLGTFLAIEDV
jgi:hypothetical protein